MVLLDSSIIVTSLPRMAQSFSVESLELSFAVSVYLLSMATFIPLSGWLADQFGAKRVFICSIVIFCIASLICGIANSLFLFIAARALQGFGAALMTPIGRVLVLNHAPKRELVKAMAMLTFPAMTAPVVGPILGGVLTTYFSWRWNFFINLPLGALAVALVWRIVPDIVPGIKRKFDLVGFVFSSGALVCVLYGLECFAHRWVSIYYCVAMMAIGFVMAACAWYHLRKSTHPLFSLQPFNYFTFSVTNIFAGIYVRVGINATPFLLPLMLQDVFEYNALQAGGYLLVYFLGSLGVKSVTTASLSLLGFRNVLACNGLLCGLFVALTGYFDPILESKWMMAVLFFAGVTRSMQFTALNTLSFADIDGPLRSSAATLSSISLQVSMVLGIAGSVVFLTTSQFFTHHDALQVSDFRIAFGLMGLITCVSSLVFFRLPKDAGAELSGRGL